jgi:hypothetical protein
MVQNKKGVEINITTIIILVLAIMVLVILGLFFSGTLKSLWEKMLGIQGVYGRDVLSSAKDKCENFFTLQQYCGEQVAIRNSKTQTEELFYCYNLPDARYKAVYTYQDAAGKTVTLKNEEDCKDPEKNPNYVP